MESRPPFPNRALVAFLVLLAVGVGVVFALADVGKFSEEGGQIWDLAWGRATLADLAVGLILAILWVHYRESAVSKALLWTIAILGLGNLALLLYVVRAALTSGGDPVRFFTGRAASSFAPATGGSTPLEQAG